MKLKDDFMIQDIEDTQFLIATGDEAFRGVVRSNPTAAFIVNQLRTATTEAAVVDAMCARYDAPRETIAADVAEILGVLRGIGALEE